MEGNVDQGIKHGDSAMSEADELHILLVDDHVDTLMVLHQLLKRKGYRVSTAASMKQALAIDSQIDFLVSDIALPDGSGHELLARLRERGPLLALAMSGFGTAADIRRSIEAGFAAHLIKPFTGQKLIEAIREVRVGGLTDGLDAQQNGSEHNGQ